MPIFRLLCTRQYFPYISFALFLAAVPLYFVSTRFIAVLPLYFVYYIHGGSAALIFRTLYPWLYEASAGNVLGFSSFSRSLTEEIRLFAVWKAAQISQDWIKMRSIFLHNSIKILGNFDIKHLRWSKTDLRNKKNVLRRYILRILVAVIKRLCHSSQRSQQTNSTSSPSSSLSVLQSALSLVKQRVYRYCYLGKWQQKFYRPIETIWWLVVFIWCISVILIQNNKIE